jgi:hypothetical protein
MPDTKPMKLNIDADIENADWTKRTWDLPEGKEFEEYLKRTNQSIEEFKKLPVYRFNVDKLPWLKKL